MEIKRYNQGFGGFGPLEQCKDGKLVKAEDVLPMLETSLAKQADLQAVLLREAKAQGVLKARISALEDALDADRASLIRERAFSSKVIVILIVALSLALAYIISPPFIPAAHADVVAMGAVNPNVTQANIHSTICVKGWTDTIRPSTRYTNKFKRDHLPLGEDIALYEADHVLPLVLGGDPLNINLQVQPWAGKCGAYAKDGLERSLRNKVCSERLTLEQAQRWFLPWRCHG